LAEEAAEEANWEEADRYYEEQASIIRNAQKVT
jgi:hypothetical protein